MGSSAEQVIIYCQTIKQCSDVYSKLRACLGEHFYHGQSVESAVLEMLHSCTPQANKANIIKAFQDPKAWFPYGRKHVVTVVEIDSFSISTTFTTLLQHIHDHMETRLHGIVKVLVATIAFWMGIDCKEVHTSIHFGPPKNVESYIQESGRVGRDGKLSKSYILYQGILLGHVENSIKEYLKTTKCRREFDESFWNFT